MAIHSNVSDLALDCIAEFTPASEPGLAMTRGDEVSNWSPYHSFSVLAPPIGAENCLPF